MRELFISFTHVQVMSFRFSDWLEKRGDWGLWRGNKVIGEMCAFGRILELIQFFLECGAAVVIDWLILVYHQGQGREYLSNLALISTVCFYIIANRTYHMLCYAPAVHETNP